MLHFMSRGLAAKKRNSKEISGKWLQQMQHEKAASRGG
jgi:hypothetical protein